MNIIFKKEFVESLNTIENFISQGIFPYGARFDGGTALASLESKLFLIKYNLYSKYKL